MDPVVDRGDGCTIPLECDVVGEVVYIARAVVHSSVQRETRKFE